MLAYFKIKSVISSKKLTQGIIFLWNLKLYSSALKLRLINIIYYFKKIRNSKKIKVK